MPGSERLGCLALHAEGLHRDGIWNEVAKALEWLSALGVRATLFVNPSGAVREGLDLSGRLAELIDRGHEVAQHTHYYAEPEGSSGGAPEGTLLTESNIRRCLERDYAFLVKAGVRPVGFVSGGWAIHSAIFDWLRSRNFAYDCSLRTYRLAYESPAARAGDEQKRPFLLNGLLEIPTTATFRNMLRSELPRTTGGVRLGGTRYDLYYLHDYDLDRRKRWLLRLLALLLNKRRATHLTTGELAAIVRAKLAE